MRVPATNRDGRYSLRSYIIVAGLLGVLSPKAWPAQASGASGDPPVTERLQPATGLVVAIRIHGDLDNARLAQDVIEAARSAGHDGAVLTLLEFDGDRWRPDVVWSIARSVGELDGPFAVWLRDRRDERVGVGAAVVGACLGRATGIDGAPTDHRLWIDPGTVIEFTPADDASGLAPASTDWESVQRELGGAIYLSFKSLGVDTRLGEALVRPHEEVWATIEKERPGQARRADLTFGPAPGQREGSSQRRTCLVSVSGQTANGPDPRAMAADYRIRIEPDVAVLLGMAHRARERGQILSSLGVVARPMRVADVESALGRSRRRLAEESAVLEQGLSRVEAAVDAAEDLKGHDAEKRRAQQCRAAIENLAECDGRIVLLEELTARYPELLMSPPPGATPVGQKTATLPTRWRSFFQGLRDRASGIRARAEQAGKL